MKLFKLSNKAHAFVLASGLIFSSYAMAGDQSSKLTNQSNRNGAAGFILVQDKIISENGCVKVDGKSKLNPGDSAELKIKDDCKWGVVRYKILNVSDNKEVGYLKHSYNDEEFSIDITSTCKGGECNFYGLSAEQNK